MDDLTKLLSSRVKAEVFRLLFGPDGLELHVREIARRAGLNEATVRQELGALAGLQLVALRRDGNRAYYRADTGNPLCPDIRNIVRKTLFVGTEASLQERAESSGPGTRERSRQEIPEVPRTADRVRETRERAASPDWAVWDQA